MRRLATAVIASILVACGATAPTTTNATTSRATAAATSAATAAVSPAATTSLTPNGARPAFLAYSFTNVRDGSKFTLSDFAGKSVLVIGMAVW